MKYQAGRIGRVIVARFDDGDDIIGGLTEIARREEIRAAAVHLVGGTTGARIVVGPEKEEMPPVPVWREITESHETVGFGTIFWADDGPRIHLHAAFGKKDSVRSGCLREVARAFIVMEAIVMEIEGVSATRELDPVSGMVLLKMQ
jgi:uncharacterized protein